MSARKKIPTKIELQQLQKLYKTDEKIGEWLGGVPAYLVAYWRRKKNIPKYSLPKFSEIEIRNLWERSGDDEKAGLELGISKAAFYNWRRRYGIKEKPAFLKLEQLEFNFPGSKYNVFANSLYGKQTLAQKIIARSAGASKLEAGQAVEIEPDTVMLHSGAGHVVETFKRSGPEYVFNPNKVVVALSYHEHAGEVGLADTHRTVAEFVKRQSIRNFFDLREGICYQVVVEKGLVLPGHLVLGTSRRVTAYGCLGALSATVTPEQMVGIWSTGKFEMTVPSTIRINITGRKMRGVYAKDIVLWIIKELGLEAAQGKVIEYAGSVVSQMTISERFVLSSLSMELGAAAAICPYDATTRRYLTGRTMTNYKPFVPDKDAVYDDMYQISIDHLAPQAGCPGDEHTVKPVAEIEELPVNEVIIGTCSSGRFDDLRVAADILKGKTVHANCRVYIYPGSRAVYLEALKKGLIRVFIEAGAMVMNPGSEPFTSVQQGALANGDRCLATTGWPTAQGRNAEGSEVYVCSPATAAASALNGVVTDPTRYGR